MSAAVGVASSSSSLQNEFQLFTFIVACCRREWNFTHHWSSSKWLSLLQPLHWLLTTARQCGLKRGLLFMPATKLIAPRILAFQCREPALTWGTIGQELHNELIISMKIISPELFSTLGKMFMRYCGPATTAFTSHHWMWRLQHQIGSMGQLSAEWKRLMRFLRSAGRSWTTRTGSLISPLCLSAWLPLLAMIWFSRSTTL